MPLPAASAFGKHAIRHKSDNTKVWGFRVRHTHLCKTTPGVMSYLLATRLQGLLN